MGGLTSTVGGLLGGTANNQNFVAQNPNQGFGQSFIPTTAEQTNNALGRSASGLDQMQQYITALQQQGGLGNQASFLKQQQELASALGQAPKAQSDVLKMQQDLAGQLGGGAQNQQNVFGQQQALANQLQNQANGQGPNPAQIQFGQNLNAATQAAAGTIASEKGISPALQAQLIAQQQGAAGQNAASGSALMQSQQQLAAQQQLAQQQQALQNVAGTQVAQQQGQQNALAANTGNQVNQLQNQQGALQNVAGSQIANQGQALNNLNAQSQNEQGLLLNSIGGQNQAQQAGQANVNNANAAMAQTNAKNSAGFANNLIFGTAGTSKGLLGGAKGGEVKKDKIDPVKGKNPKFNMSKIPEHFHPIIHIFHPHLMMADGGEIPLISDDGSELGMSRPAGGGITGALKQAGPMLAEAAMAEGGEATSTSSQTEPAPPYDPNSDFAREVSKGFSEQMYNGGQANYQKGAMVPGKPKVNHNSVKNDVVPAILSPGEVVIPLNIMKSKDPVQGAADFVKALMDKHQSKDNKKDKSEFHKALKEAIQKRKS